MRSGQREDRFDPLGATGDFVLKRLKRLTLSTSGRPFGRIEDLSRKRASRRDSVGFDILGDPDKPMLVCDFIQARDPAWVRKPFFAEFDKTASWFDELRPAFGRARFYFEGENEPAQPRPLLELSEMLLE